MSSHLSAMAIEFNTLQRETLTAIVDTFVAAVPSENDPDGFYAAKGSDDVHGEGPRACVARS